MTEVAIEIGGRVYEVACQSGEEHFLQSAATKLDAEARALIGQIGRMPEVRMLLMSGLMLSDRTAGLSDELEKVKSELEATREKLAALESAPPPRPERIEVAVIPDAVKDTLAEIAARTEALAGQVEEKVATP